LGLADLSSSTTTIFSLTRRMVRHSL
jgi:hypothetical protein